ncbi:hypothetical protein [Desulfatitalea alkaliphila]|uniref:Uncharacterized protein n=1 Tax=Desulfatitalea alkaliphila TaxID=2929485 RepID=A0AA41UJE0_9BACT|nr:hypothetical protein [Desulfatitalea alkaliphila]MCJ8500442.1 hypothetical protein [Desulfatitalea alkaliphila]
MIALVLLLAWQPFAFAGKATSTDDLEKGLDHLLGFVASEQSAEGLDRSVVDDVLQYVEQSPEMAQYTPRERDGVRGAFLSYAVERPLDEVVRYAYNRRIPEGASNPSSIHFARWTSINGASDDALPDIWPLLTSLEQPTVIRGVSRETIAPDLHTGAYYAYDLQRAIVLLQDGSRRAVISLSNQIGHSDVGRKGVIVGDDKDWNYLYTEAQGVNKAGLGWVKSRIYQFLSVCIYIEDQASPGIVKMGVFQWLGAGWAGFNMVDTHHIQKGLERYAVQFKAMMTADEMPEPQALEALYDVLHQSDEGLLRKTAYDVTRHIHGLAKKGDSARERRTADDVDPRTYVDGLDREELVTVIMREYVKHRLGKGSPLASAFWVAIKANGERPKPL